MRRDLVLLLYITSFNVSKPYRLSRSAYCCRLDRNVSNQRAIGPGPIFVVVVVVVVYLSIYGMKFLLNFNKVISIYIFYSVFSHLSERDFLSTNNSHNNYLYNKTVSVLMFYFKIL